MQTTRQQILDYLKIHPGASAKDISRSLDQTTANIRYHLELLENSGLVQVSGKRVLGGAGRPILLFNLTSFSLGTNITPLLSMVLNVISDKPTAKDDFQVIADTIARNFDPDSKNRITRFNQAIEFLNQHKYHASWEAHPAGPQVLLRHCPYRDLALKHPELCLIDTNLISILFDIPLELTSKRTFDKNPFSPCIFKPNGSQS
ncbi:MAG: helix-turn-helix domain-containing protein [Anaerolineales bacterium]